METYKIGNKVDGIIRAYAPCTIGDTVIQYGNEPYTLLKGQSARLTFRDITTDVRSGGRDLFHNKCLVDKITISDVELTKKIMNLIYSKSEIKLAHKAENYTSTLENKIFLNAFTPKIYQVFIYNDLGVLEKAYGELSTEEPLIVEKAESNYLIIYSFEKEVAFDLNKVNNIYLTLDLEINGNLNDETTKMWVHLDKCGLQVEKNLYFQDRSNAADLTFYVIDDKDSKNYITVE